MPPYPGNEFIMFPPKAGKGLKIICRPMKKPELVKGCCIWGLGMFGRMGIWARSFAKPPTEVMPRTALPTPKRLMKFVMMLSLSVSRLRNTHQRLPIGIVRSTQNPDAPPAEPRPMEKHCPQKTGGLLDRTP